MCEGLGVAPSQFRGRPTVTTTIVQDNVTTTVTASPWTPEDRVLMVAWRIYQDGLCSGCGFPKATSWHHLNDGVDVRVDGEFVCQTCTAAQPVEGGERKPVTYPAVVDEHDYDKNPLPGPPQPQIL